MSVTFYDPENPVQYDDDYQVVGGGPEANFNNSNARIIIELLGLETDPSLYGETTAENLLETLKRAEVTVEAYFEDEKYYFLSAISDLQKVAEESLKNGSGKIVWG